MKYGQTHMKHEWKTLHKKDSISKKPKFLKYILEKQEAGSGRVTFSVAEQSHHGRTHFPSVTAAQTSLPDFKREILSKILHCSRHKPDAG